MPLTQINIDWLCSNCDFTFGGLNASTGMKIVDSEFSKVVINITKFVTENVL